MYYYSFLYNATDVDVDVAVAVAADGLKNSVIRNTIYGSIYMTLMEC